MWVRIPPLVLITTSHAVQHTSQSCESRSARVVEVSGIILWATIPIGRGIRFKPGRVRVRIPGGLLLWYNADMIKLQDRVPEWVYRLSRIVGDNVDGVLPEYILNAKVLSGHVADIRAKYNYVLDYDEYLEPRHISTMPRKEQSIKVIYIDGTSYTFDSVGELQIFMLNEESYRTYYIIFKAINWYSGELEWYVGNPVKVYGS